jgi:hypothetical protein
MRTRSSYRLPLMILSIFAALLVIFLNQTDLGNWLKKSDYAEWGRYIEEDLTAQKAEVLLVDFGTLPEGDDEFYVVVEIAEPTHEYDLERLFGDMQRIIVGAYLKLDSPPSQPDSIATILRLDPDVRMAVVAPFSSALDYVQTGAGYEAFVDTWRFGLDLGDDLELEE